jgi:hypothetical protein
MEFTGGHFYFFSIIIKFDIENEKIKKSLKFGSFIFRRFKVKVIKTQIGVVVKWGID